MLRSIERDELDARRFEQKIDGASPFAIATGVIGQQAHSFASNELQRVGEEDLDTGNYAGGLSSHRSGSGDG